MTSSQHFVRSAVKLPPRANLEHLKNEAKQLLKAMRSHNPAARLADAQLAVARNYGFASWRRLKAYLDAFHQFAGPLVHAIHNSELKTLDEILSRHPELVDASTQLPDRERPSDAPTMPLLHLAIAENKLDVLQSLIEHGADLNVRNTEGRLPLHDCFELGRDDLAKALLNSGAIPDVCAAAAYGLHDQLREILTREPALSNDLTTGESPLGWSVYGAQPVSTEILFEHGAIVDRPPYDTYAWGPAAMVASTAVTPVLLKHRANPNWQNSAGNTPIHLVITSRIVLDPAGFVELLLKSGADVTLRNRQGRTPLEEALAQTGRVAETYFPVRPIGPKKLDRTIDLLRSAQQNPG